MEPKSLVVPELLPPVTTHPAPMVISQPSVPEWCLLRWLRH